MKPITASDLMNTTVLSVDPQMTAARLADFLVNNEISGAPVLDGERLVGVVSLFDVVATDPRTLVEDLMTQEVVTVDEDTGVSAIARLMVDRHLHRVVVVQQDSIIGIISTSDMLGLLVET